MDSVLEMFGSVHSSDLPETVRFARKSDVIAIAALFVFVMYIVDTVGLVVSAFSGYQWFVWGIIGYWFRRYRNDGTATECSVPSPGNSARFPNLLGAS